MLPEKHAFWVRGEDGGEYGPVAPNELREWVRENRAGLGTEVRLDEPGALWQPWQYYPELVALLAEIQGAGPVPGQSGPAIAPMGRRVLACVLDLVLSAIAAYPIIFVVMSVSVPDLENQLTQILLQPQAPVSPQFFHYWEICNVISFAIMLLYMGGFQAAHGQTPAKALLHLKIVDQTGEKPRLAACCVRALAYVLSVNLLCIPFAYAFFNPQRRAFHDFMAGTYVVEA